MVHGIMERRQNQTRAPPPSHHHHYPATAMFYNSRTFRVLRFKFRRSVSRRMCVRRPLLKTFTMLAGTAEWSRGGHAQRQRLGLYGMRIRGCACANLCDACACIRNGDTCVHIHCNCNLCERVYERLSMNSRVNAL